MSLIRLWKEIDELERGEMFKKKEPAPEVRDFIDLCDTKPKPSGAEMKSLFDRLKGLVKNSQVKAFPVGKNSPLTPEQIKKAAEWICQKDPEDSKTIAMNSNVRAIDVAEQPRDPNSFLIPLDFPYMRADQLSSRLPIDGSSVFSPEESATAKPGGNDVDVVQRKPYYVRMPAMAEINVMALNAAIAMATHRNQDTDRGAVKIPSGVVEHSNLPVLIGEPQLGDKELQITRGKKRLRGENSVIYHFDDAGFTNQIVVPDKIETAVVEIPENATPPDPEKVVLIPTGVYPKISSMSFGNGEVKAQRSFASGPDPEFWNRAMRRQAAKRNKKGKKK